MIEILEERNLKSAAVQQDYPGFYHIFGEENVAYNEIHIHLDEANHTATLDGVTFGPVDYLTIVARADYDDVQVIGQDGQIGITADFSQSGGDYCLFQWVSGYIQGSPGPDNVHLWGGHRSEAFLGDGNDFIEIAGGCVDSEIDAGNGNDIIDATSNSYRVNAHTGGSSTGGHDTYYGGSGGDIVDVGWGTGDGARIYCGSGDDVISCWNGVGEIIDGGGGTDEAYADGLDRFSNVEIIR